jgi:hypothetical protein
MAGAYGIHMSGASGQWQCSIVFGMTVLLNSLGGERHPFGDVAI